MALAQQQGVQTQREADGNVPFYRYRARGASHTVYFEDAASTMRKFEVVRARGYGPFFLNGPPASGVRGPKKRGDAAYG